MDRPPIVITGAALTCGLGLSPESVWRKVLDGRSQAGPMPALESSLAAADASGYQAVDLPGDFHPDDPREVRYLKWMLDDALRRARAEAAPYPPHRRGIVLGTTLHGMRAAGRFLRSGDNALLSDFLAGDILQRAARDSMLGGDALTTCSACSSSLGAVALAITLLETGQLDLVVAGGYDTVSEYAYGGFNSLRLVADGPLRPFAKDRQGMKLGEGYGLLVLERADDAKKRGVEPLAQILGFGESADAHHLTQPHPQGEGAAAAMSAALQRANLTPQDIDLVAAHATGTPDNDAGEYAALAKVFGNDLPRVPVVGFKSHIGHTLGGAGAVELILSMMALRDQTLPATAHLAPDEIEFPNLNVVTGTPRPAQIRATLNTSLGFGGANTCVILGPLAVSRWPLAEQSDAAPRHTAHGPRPTVNDVFITGIGIVLPGAVGNDAFIQRLDSTDAPASGPIPEADYLHLLNARRVRRMSDYVKLTLAAATLACRDAGIEADEAFGSSCHAILGTTHGSSSYCTDYYGQIVREGMAAANPMLFAEGVPNAAAAHLSLMLSLKGSCQTIIGSRTAGLDALRLAAGRIAGGQWDRALVSAAEEWTPQVNAAYAHHGLYNESAPPLPFADAAGFRGGAGAVTFTLESGRSLSQRGGRARGKIESSASARHRPGRAPAAIARVLRSLNHPQYVIGSSNNTRIDRLEAAMVVRHRSDSRLSSLYGHFPELFSAGPLASIAATLLSGQLPALRGIHPDGPLKITPATGREQPHAFTVLCTGYTGTIAGIHLRVETLK
jgi:3-oxoacyl-[acyl-carrier-protein] synthase II